jgi:hypothetical protein
MQCVGFVLLEMSDFMVHRGRIFADQLKKETRRMGTSVQPKTITFGDNYWQMHHNKLAKRAKQTDDCILAKTDQFVQLAKYISKGLHASGTKLGVEDDNYHTPQQNMGVMTMMA